VNLLYDDDGLREAELKELLERCRKVGKPQVLPQGETVRDAKQRRAQNHEIIRFVLPSMGEKGFCMMMRVRLLRLFRVMEDLSDTHSTWSPAHTRRFLFSLR
jgi:hypothetical protein